MRIKLFEKRERKPAEIVCKFSPQTEAALKQAERAFSTDNLVTFLAAVAGLNERKAIQMGRRGWFTSYLIQLNRGQFTPKSWSEGLTILYRQELNFDTVDQAKIWLRQHKNDFQEDDWW